MLLRYITISIVAGLVAALGATAFQMLYSVPLILEAEKYEVAEAAPGAGGHVHVDALSHEHGDATAADPSGEGAEWVPVGGFERSAYTFAANALAGIGFAMLLVGGLVVRGVRTSAQVGALWGAGGFLAFSFAPYFGLPPELPGMVAAGLVERQVWWVATAGATIFGLGLIVFPIKSLSRIGSAVIGVGVILAPHTIGAPEAVHLAEASAVPAELASKFAVVSVAHGAVLWLIIGSVAGWLFGRGEEASSKAA